MNLSDFIALHAVFDLGEVRLACFQGKKKQTALTALYRAEKAGRIRRLKRGVYQTKPIGVEHYPSPSPMLVASRLAKDAILSHHLAFEALGFSHSIFTKLATYLTNSPRHKIEILGVNYQPLLHPDPLRRRGRETWGVVELRIGGLSVKVTCLERTFIDSLHGMRWVGGWEEFCLCISKVSHFNIDRVLEYSSLIGSPSLYSRLGFFLEENRERLYIDDKTLEILYKEKSRTRIPLIMGYPLKGDLKNKWNVVVPKEIIVNLGDLT